MSVILIIIGGALTCFSFWLLLHLSDEKVQRHFRSWWTDKMSHEDAEGFRTMNGALIAVFFMVMGMVLLVGGVARLFGLMPG
jgi:hypothetical protein